MAQCKVSVAFSYNKIHIVLLRLVLSSWSATRLYMESL
jgi:hypothetical protein